MKKNNPAFFLPGAAHTGLVSSILRCAAIWEPVVGGWLIRASAVAGVDHCPQWCLPGRILLVAQRAVVVYTWPTHIRSAAQLGVALIPEQPVKGSASARPGKATLWVDLDLSVRKAEAWWRVQQRRLPAKVW